MTNKKPESMLETFGIEPFRSIGGFVLILKRLLFVFIVIPSRALKALFLWLSDPKWSQITAIERSLILPVVELFGGEHGASVSIAKMADFFFEKFHYAKSTGTKPSIRPKFEDIAIVTQTYRIVKILTIVFMMILYFFVYEIMIAVWDQATNVIMFIGAGLTFFVGTATSGAMAASFASMLVGFFLWSVKILATIIVMSMLSWMVLTAYHLLIYLVKTLQEIDSEELEGFVDYNLDYVITKIAEVEGIDMALDVRDAVIESLVSKTDHDGSGGESAKLQIALKEALILGRRSSSTTPEEA